MFISVLYVFMLLRACVLLHLFAGALAGYKSHAVVTTVTPTVWLGGGPAVALRVTDAIAMWEGGTGVVVARFRWYVNQPTASRVELDVTAMEGFPPSVSSDHGAEIMDCGVFRAYDAAVLPPDTGVACQEPGCALIARAFIPTYLSSQMPVEADVWLEYSATLRCVTSAHTNAPVNARVRVPYAISNSAGELFTVTESPPYVTFSMTYSFPAATTTSLSFTFTGAAVKLPAAALRTAHTLTEAVIANENTSAPGSFSWGDGLAFRMQLADPADRAFWYLRPLVTVLAVSGTPLPNASSSGDVSATSKLGASWCDVSGEGILDVASVLPPPLPALVETLVDPAVLHRLRVTANQSAALSRLRPGAPVSVVWDSTGGLAVPLLNRLPDPRGSVSVVMCAIVQVVPYTPLYESGYYPLYVTRDAAVRNSGGGNVTEVALGPTAYFLPHAAPLVCVPPGASNTPPGSELSTSERCVARAAEEAQGRRRRLLGELGTYRATTVAVLLGKDTEENNIVMWFALITAAAILAALGIRAGC